MTHYRPIPNTAPAQRILVDRFGPRTPPRAGASDDELNATIVEPIARKPGKHGFQIALGSKPALSRPMARTGG